MTVADRRRGRLKPSAQRRAHRVFTGGSLLPPLVVSSAGSKPPHCCSVVRVRQSLHLAPRCLVCAWIVRDVDGVVGVLAGGGSASACVSFRASESMDASRSHAGVGRARAGVVRKPRDLSGRDDRLLRCAGCSRDRVGPMRSGQSGSASNRGRSSPTRIELSLVRELPHDHRCLASSESWSR